METAPKKNLSELELQLIKFLAGTDGMSARQVAEEFGEEHGYAQTTIMTLLERLRKKGYVTREKPSSVFIYQSALSQTELTQSVIKKFVGKALDGSVVPLVAFLAKDQELSDEEVAQLRKIFDGFSEVGEKQ